MKFNCYIEGISSHSSICHIRFASIAKPRTKLQPLFYPSYPDDQMNCKNKATICMCDTAVNYFPRGIAQIFPNIMKLEIVCCGMKKISRADLSGLEGLTSLHLDGNELQTLPNNLFKGMIHLSYVSFNSNKINYLDSKVLKPISKNKIEMIDFEKNPGIDACYATTLDMFSSKSCKTLADLMRLIDRTFKSENAKGAESEPDNTDEDIDDTGLNATTSDISRAGSELNLTDDSSCTLEYDDARDIDSEANRRFARDLPYQVLSKGYESDTSDEVCFFVQEKLQDDSFDDYRAEGFVPEERSQMMIESPQPQQLERANVVATMQLASVLQLTEKRNVQENILIWEVENVDPRNIAEIFKYFKIGYETKSRRLTEVAYNKIKTFYGEAMAIEALRNSPLPVQKYFGLIPGF